MIQNNFHYFNPVDQGKYVCKQCSPDETPHHEPSHQDLHFFAILLLI